MGGCCTPIIGGRPPSSSGGGEVSALGLLDYQTEQDDSVFSTGSGVYVSTGKTMVTPALVAADYRIGVAYQCSCTTIGEGQWRVRLDGVSNVWPTDHNQDFTLFDDERFPAYRSRVIALGAGVHTFELETKQTGGVVTTTRATYFEIWRVPPSSSGQKVDPCVCTNQVQSTAFALTVARVLAGRTFVTPALAAGVYRLSVSLTFRLVSGSSFDFNIDQDAGGDIYPTDFRDRASTSGDANARHLVRELTLGAGAHTFDLAMLSSSTTSIILEATTWTLQRVDGAP